MIKKEEKRNMRKALTVKGVSFSDKFLFSILFIFIFSLISVSAQGFILNERETNIYFLNESEIRLANMTDVTISNPQNEDFLRYSSGSSKWIQYQFDLSDYWDYDYTDLINEPTALSDFSDDLGDRGYTSVSNFTNDNNYWNDTYATFNETYADTLYAGIEWDYNQTIPAVNEILGYNYYNSTSLTMSIIQALGFYNTTEVNDINTSMKNYVDYTNGTMKNYVDSTFITQANEGNLNVNSSNYWDGYDDPTEIKAGDSDLLDGYDSSFFLPLNESLVGNYNFTGQFDYNGGWTSFLVPVNLIKFFIALSPFICFGFIFILNSNSFYIFP